jgi:leader peptidase (prepilin peptidase) / N-methyltransferase
MTVVYRFCDNHYLVARHLVSTTLAARPLAPGPERLQTTAVPHPWIIAATLALPLGWLAALAARRLDGAARALPAAAFVAAMVLLFAWAAVVVSPTLVLAASLALAWALVVLGGVDVTAFRLPDAVTLPLVAAGLALSSQLPGQDVIGHLAGAVAGYAALAAIAFAYRRLRGREGLGMGDAKLLAAAGAWLGWQALPSVVLIACAGGFLWVLAAIVIRGRSATTGRIPFGAPLCAAFWLVWLYGPIEAFAA